MSEPVYAMQTAVNVVTEKMASLNALSNTYSRQLQGSLTALGNIRMDDVSQPVVITPPATPVPVITVGAAPTYTPDMLVMPADHVILESKSAGRASDLDRALWRAGHRPSGISKIGTGTAALHPELPGNKWARTLAGPFAGAQPANLPELPTPHTH